LDALPGKRGRRDVSGIAIALRSELGIATVQYGAALAAVLVLPHALTFANARTTAMPRAHGTRRRISEAPGD
jgi:hypothetical protein